MQLTNLEEQRFTDPIPALIMQTYLQSASSPSPCKLCQENPQQQGKRVHFHGSDIGACPRKTYFTMTEGGQPQPAGVKSVSLQDGHLHEKMILDALTQKFNIVFGENKELRLNVPMWDDESFVQRFVRGEFQDYNYSDNRIRTYLLIGHFDGLMLPVDKELLQDDDNINPIILECKAVGDYTWREVKKGNIQDTWFGQMQIYMLMTDAKKAYLLVKNRTTSELMLPIRIDYDEAWVVKKIRMLTTIYKCINLKREYPKPSHKRANETECKFCPFIGRCYSGKEQAEQS